jgi:hypothetical protein
MKIDNILSFIKESFQGPDGKASSKKLTAYWLVGLITIIVLTLLAIAYLAVFRQVILSDNAIRLLDIIATAVLFALLGAVLALYGVSAWTGVKSLSVLNPKPPDKIDVKDNEVVNVNAGKVEE